MKNIKIEIEAREALELRKQLKTTAEFIEKHCKKNEATYLTTGLIQSLNDKIENGLKDQLSLAELKEATAHLLDHEE